MATSLGRSNKISHHLFPLISKFEALDTLSHRIYVPSLRPAPLQISRNSSPRRGGTDGPASTTFDSIFSPRRGSQSRHEDMFSEHMMVSGTNDVGTSGTIKKSGSGRLKQTQSPFKVSNIRLRDLAEQNNSATLKDDDYNRKVRARIAASKPMAKGGRENSVVRERIKFYDGCMEHTSLSATCPNLHDSNSAHGSPLPATTVPNTNAGPPLQQIVAPTTPRIHKPNCTRRSGAQPSTAGRWKAKTISTKAGTPQTPTRPDSSYGSKRRKPFAHNVPNPFLQTPHTNPPTRHVSPKTTSSGRSPEKLGFLGRPLLEATKALDSTKDASPEETRGRPRVREPPAQRVNLVAPGRRKTSNKLDALYCTESLERPGGLTIGQRGSKNQELKMLCERGVVAKTFESGPWSLSKVTAARISRPKWRDFSNTTPVAPLPQAPPLSTTKSTGPCKPVQKPRQLDETSIPSLIRREQVCPSTHMKGSCRGIHDKIKRWESKGDIKGICREEQRDFPPKETNNLLTLRKSIFENPWNEEVGKELQKRGLDGQEVQAVVNEFQDVCREIHNEPSRGKWRMVVAPRLGRGGLTAQKDRSTEESGDMDMRIIVREAQCGLEEPKPLRLLEMKRMILLCRERPVGIPVYKDRGGPRIK